ncbi:hypothetical protein AVEN_62267-1 [Araneus ventricosus]|uniref:Uncharacterized protein n=1 Tax=Araneus ventricosus TaxID=182803 RepID=A0A4Y2ECE9_ARAVE|nr:hypothetical protein AVEN_62267-1 [Araneus ventricosus]
MFSRKYNLWKLKWHIISYSKLFSVVMAVLSPRGLAYPAKFIGQGEVWHLLLVKVALEQNQENFRSKTKKTFSNHPECSEQFNSESDIDLAALK